MDPNTPEVKSLIWERDRGRGLVAELPAELLEGGPAGGGPPFVI